MVARPTRLLGLLLWLLLGLRAAQAHTIDLPASTKECFFEDLHADDKVRFLEQTAHTMSSRPKELMLDDLDPLFQMTVTYQVAGGGHLDVDFWVLNPKGKPMYEQSKKDTGTYSFTAKLECAMPSSSTIAWSVLGLTTHLNSGKYSYCFSNKFSSVTAKTVMFTVSGVMYVDDDGERAADPQAVNSESARLKKRDFLQDTRRLSKRRFAISQAT